MLPTTHKNKLEISEDKSLHQWCQATDPVKKIMKQTDVKPLNADLAVTGCNTHRSHQSKV